MWGVGVVLWEMLAATPGQVPYDWIDTDDDMIEAVTKGYSVADLRLRLPTDPRWATLTTLARSCLDRDPNLRPTAAQASARLRHVAAHPVPPADRYNGTERGVVPDKSSSASSSMLKLPSSSSDALPAPPSAVAVKPEPTKVVSVLTSGKFHAGTATKEDSYISSSGTKSAQSSLKRPGSFSVDESLRNYRTALMSKTVVELSQRILDQDGAVPTMPPYLFSNGADANPSSHTVKFWSSCSFFRLLNCLHLSTHQCSRCLVVHYVCQTGVDTSMTAYHSLLIDTLVQLKVVAASIERPTSPPVVVATASNPVSSIASTSSVPISTVTAAATSTTHSNTTASPPLVLNTSKNNVSTAGGATGVPLLHPPPHMSSNRRSRSPSNPLPDAVPSPTPSAQQSSVPQITVKSPSVGGGMGSVVFPAVASALMDADTASSLPPSSHKRRPSISSGTVLTDEEIARTLVRVVSPASRLRCQWLVKMVVYIFALNLRNHRTWLF
jgi:hypothetical protein